VRNLSSAAVGQLTASQLYPALLVDITFLTGVYHAWTGVGNYSCNGNTYIGVGDLGKLGEISEGTDVNANGTSITLSGIDNTLLADALSEVGALLPVTATLAFFTPSIALVASQVIFQGVVDKPTIKIGTDTSTITLNLETRMLLLQRGTQRMWTQADQALDYPLDTAFRLVSALQNAAYAWK
jgi:hypothetical protein